MLKKTLAATALAGALLLGTAAAAVADEYPPTATITVSSPTVAPGGSVVITATGLGDREIVTFAHNAPAGSSIASIAFASAVANSVDKPVSNGTSSATFTPATSGTWTVTVYDGSTVLGSTTVTAAVPGAPATGGSALPPTGGSVPAAAIWAGVGAVGLGGIAVAAVAARRRTQKI